MNSNLHEYSRKLMPWVWLGIYQPIGWNMYSMIVGDTTDWIESHPLRMWKHGAPCFQKHGYADDNGFRRRYILSPELESWFLLRWS